MAVRAEHREHPALGVVGVLEALAPVRLSIILVGADQPCHHVATIGIAGLGEQGLPRVDDKARQVLVQDASMGKIDF